MTEAVFRKHVIISIAAVVAAIGAITAFCAIMFDKYSVPSEENTSVASNTVEEVYYATGIESVIIEMSDGEKFQLVCPGFQQELYSTIGYNLTQLSELLEGKEIEYRRMNKLSWIVEIYIDGITVSNKELTSKQITLTRIGMIILSLIMLTFPIGGAIIYIEGKYKLYIKAEKKAKKWY